jgi:cell wall-associated NlpC family hydrolase
MHLTKAGTAAAQKAVEFALAQVGKPYVFGAAGPGSYDCSGLTMAAWQAGGVSLPHSAADQYNYGHHVSRDALQPGDLIFFYQPIGHVTIYIGQGMMVSAPTEGQNVSVVPLSSFDSDYVGATRLV